MTERLTFSEACAYLFPRTSGPKDGAWTLEPIRRLLGALGHPERHLPAIHIGGSNGKGSVVTLVGAALRESGARVALFTSPHLVDVRERFVVDTAAISPDAFAMWTSRLRETIEATGASFFEVCTAIACADAAARGAEVIVVEVGLGGRLDSTNVIDPLVSAVTTVSLEHVEYLGHTLADIAREKAGIAKRNRPFVVGESDGTVAQILAAEGAARGARVRRVDPAATFKGPLGLIGPHQRRNAAVADAVLDALPSRIRPSVEMRARAYARASVPGRFQRMGRWVLDVAHNRAGIDALVATLATAGLPRPVVAVFGALADKEGAAMTNALLTVCDRVWVTAPPDIPDGRPAWVPGDDTDDRVVFEPMFDDAMLAAEATPGTIVVTGSFYTVGAAIRRLPAFAASG